MFEKVTEKDPRSGRVPLPAGQYGLLVVLPPAKVPSEISCVVVDWFVQRTVSPTVMRRLVGTNTKLAGPRTLTILVVAASRGLRKPRNGRIPASPTNASLYAFIEE